MNTKINGKRINNLHQECSSSLVLYAHRYANESSTLAILVDEKNNNRNADIENLCLKNGYSSSSSSDRLTTGKKSNNQKQEEKKEDDGLVTLPFPTLYYQPANEDDYALEQNSNKDEEKGNNVQMTFKSGDLNKRFGIASPLDRMLVSANGNLQQVLSAYFDAPIYVDIQSCHALATKANEKEQEWDRVAHLQVYNRTICVAKTHCILHDAEKCQHLLKERKLGLAQLFRALNRQPTFTLLDAGYISDQQTGKDESAEDDDNAVLWRRYTLQCPELSCWIYETFVPHRWNMELFSL